MSTSCSRRLDAGSPSFRDGPKDQTSDAQLRIGESRDSGFDASHRPGMTAFRIGALLATTTTARRVGRAKAIPITFPGVDGFREGRDPSYAALHHEGLPRLAC